MIGSKDLNDLYQIFVIIQQVNKTGISIGKALKLYEAQSKRPKIKKMLAGIRQNMDGGIPITESFAKYPDFFPEYIVEMMRVNEGTGEAAGVYDDIVRTLEQEIDLRRNIGSQVGQMIFLGALLAITIGVVVFVLLPSMSDLMNNLNMEVPIYTKILLSIGVFSKNYWWLILAVMVVLAVGIRNYAKRSPEKIAKFVLHLPLYGQIAYFQMQYRFALIFGLCRNAGLNSIDALKYTQKGVNNVLMTNLIKRSLQELGRYGSNVTLALQKQDKEHVLDDSYYIYLSAGEQGNMGELMASRVEFYKKQLIVSSQQFSNNLNNILITPSFILLGLILFSIMQPMFSMMFQMSKGGMGL